MSNKILMVLIGVLLILMVGLGGGLFMMWNKLATLDAQKTAEASEESGEPVAIERPLGPIESLDTFIVNLADKSGNRYLRITMDLELEKLELEDEVKKRLPQIRDSILMILSTKSFEDINSVAGKITLRDEIQDKINGYLALGKITNVYFKEFVVQ
jgi:flagellar FliL protein